jgi:hypothetical protein
MTDDLREPAPGWLTPDRIDGDAIQTRLATMLEVERPELFAELLAGALSWTLEPFDGEGWTTVRVIRKATGEDTEAGMQTHWSAVVRPA